MNGGNESESGGGHAREGRKEKKEGRKEVLKMENVKKQLEGLDYFCICFPLNLLLQAIFLFK